MIDPHFNIFVKMKSQMDVRPETKIGLLARIQNDTTFAKRKTGMRSWQKYSVAAAALVMTAAAVIIGIQLKHTKPQHSAGIYLPMFKIPQKIKNVMYSSTGYFVYQGRIYTPEGSVRIAADSVDSLKGKYLGQALGGNTSGKIYSVKGYDSDFRVSINGYLLFASMNDIYLNTGKDYYGDRVHLKGNIKEATYEVLDSGNDQLTQRKSLDGVTDDDWKDFVTAVYDSSYVSMENDSNLSKLLAPNGSHEPYKVRLYFELKDGIEISMILFEDGYIYGPHEPVMLNVTDPVFKKMFDLAMGR